MEPDVYKCLHQTTTTKSPSHAEKVVIPEQTIEQLLLRLS